LERVVLAYFGRKLLQTIIPNYHFFNHKYNGSRYQHKWYFGLKRPAFAELFALYLRAGQKAH